MNLLEAHFNGSNEVLQACTESTRIHAILGV